MGFTAFSTTACLTPEDQTLPHNAYRHNPYSYKLLNEQDRDAAVQSFVELYKGLSANSQKHVRALVSSSSRQSSACPSPVPQELAVAEKVAAEVASTKSAAAESGNDDDVSESSSEVGSGDRSSGVKDSPDSFSVTGSHHLPLSAVASSAASSAASAAAPAVIRYASVNFRFGSAWFVAPFRTFAGDMVVVQYPGNNNSLHMGLVSSITTAKPITFYTEDNMDSNDLSPEELETVPRLLRHARDFDKETKLDLRSHDLRSLANARKLAEEMAAPVQFLDAEWLLDLSAVTFLVKVFGSTELADQLVDELAMQEGAEVVFTYPVPASMY